MLKIMKYSELKSAKYKLYLPFDVQSKSSLYICGSTLYKIPFNVDESLNDNLKYLDSLNLNELIELKDLIYEENVLKGYSFKKYYHYKSLRRYRNRDLKEKQNDCEKIISAFNKLLDNNIIYRDFHTGNILLDKRNNDIKICDLDDIEISSSKDLKKRVLKEIPKLIFSYLYNLSILDMEVVEKEKLCLYKDKILDEYFNSLDIGTLKDFSRILSLLDLSFIKENTKPLKAKIKEFKYNGYYNLMY